MLSINGVCTLANVVIVDPAWVDLVSRVSHGVVATIMVTIKYGFYHDQFLTKMLLPLNVEVFECLH
jgi:hypothetical protein